MKLSVYLITKNEDQRLNKTLAQAAKVADEILVVDSGSTDDTLNIAKKFGAKTIHHDWHSYCDQKHFAEQQCANDWVLMLDADEVLSEELVEEINRLKSGVPEFNAYQIKIVNMFPQDEMPRRFAHSFKPVRLYNRKFASMPKDLYNKDRVNVAKGQKIGKLKNHIHHFCILTLEQATNKYNIHSSELVKTLAAEKRKVSKLRIFTEFPRQFLHYYIGKRYCLLGTQGYIQALVLANFRFLKIAKYYEFTELNKKKKD